MKPVSLFTYAIEEEQAPYEQSICITRLVISDMVNPRVRWKDVSSKISTYLKEFASGFERCFKHGYAAANSQLVIKEEREPVYFELNFIFSAAWLIVHTEPSRSSASPINKNFFYYDVLLFHNVSG